MQISIHHFLPACLFVKAVQSQEMKPFAPGIDRLLAEAGLQIDWGRGLQATNNLANMVNDVEDKCNSDLIDLLEDNTKLQQELNAYFASSITTPPILGDEILRNQGDDIHVTIEYPETVNKELKETCDAAGGYYVSTDRALDCTIALPGMEEISASIEGFATCVADTEVCKQMNVFVTLVAWFEGMGIACDLPGASGNSERIAGNEGEAFIAAEAGQHSALGYWSLAALVVGAVLV